MSLVWDGEPTLTSSLGHVLVVTSAILFAFLTIALGAAQFRKKRGAFTLVNVAAALADVVTDNCIVFMRPQTET